MHDLLALHQRAGELAPIGSALGAQSVILKPFDPMTLAAEVQGHLQALGPH